MTDDRMDDARVEELARRLGAGAAERLNVERLAGAVVERLRNEPKVERRGPSPWWMQPKWLRAAAVVVLMVGVGLLVRGRMQSGSRHTARYIAEELRDLSTSQLREVLVTLDETLEAASPSSSDDDLNDLTTEQLQAVLRSLEG
jgi:ParB-like chromosome segregation protein Spo0J